MTESDPRSARNFATTRWSLVVAAGESLPADSPPTSQAALAELCEAYWYPLYAYARRRLPEDQAMDLTQAFFVWLIEKNRVSAADPSRGRFRSFLLKTMQNFLANEWTKQQATKRGGGKLPMSLNFAASDSKLSLEPADGETPEHLYERQWAVALLDRVLSQLRTEYAEAGKQRIFDELKPLLAGASQSDDYATAARELGWTDNATRVAAHRLRTRYRELLRTEISQTVATPDEVEDEIRWLFEVFAE